MARRSDAGSVRGARTVAGAMRGPLQVFVRSETRGAGLLVLAGVLALVWANIDIAGYETFWATELSVHLGSWQLSLSPVPCLDMAL